MNSTLWGPPPHDLAATIDEVHAWRIALDPPEASLRGLRRTLASDELARADRFHAAVHRDRFTAGRGALRAILGLYLGRPPASLAFEVGPHGKPALAATDIEFNLSHSAGLALLAVSRGRRVGIDVEAVRAIAEMRGIVARSFSPRERSDFDALPEARRLDAFFRGWTSKEAYIKAIGTGLATRLDSFSVAINPEAPPALLDVADRPDEPARWTFLDPCPGPGYAAALAAEGGGWMLRRFEHDQ